jgi:aspartate/methionine/tyrosine aminotransferase
MNERVRKAKRLLQIKPSSIRRMFSLTQQDPKVINLGIGEPDFPSPPHVNEAVSRAMREGKTHYPPTNGIPELREALAKKAKKDYGLIYDPESEILVTVGATEAIFLALMATINPEEEVLIPDPGFLCYEPAVRLCGGIPIHVSLQENKSFTLNFSSVISQITDKTKVIIVNSPHNPTGSVFSYEDLARLAKLAVEYDLIVISDEVYEKITYDNVKHHCMATFPGMRDRAIIVNSFSKTYAMTGFRLGFVYGPAELVSSMLLVHQYLLACVDGPAQYGGLAALEGSQDCVEEMVHEFNRRRLLIHSRLNKMEGVRCSLPKGAFYVFPNVKSFGVSSESLAEHLLKEAKVITVPGSGFGAKGEGYLRLSYATSYEQIEEALDRIEVALKKLARTL